MRWRCSSLGALIGLMACTQPPATDDAPEAEAIAPAEERAGFVNRVWSVAERSDGGDPGSLYVFLSDSTLVISSPNATPLIGSWRAQANGLVMIEEGVEYNVDILGVGADEFRIRSHNPGEPLDLRFVPAGGATVSPSTDDGSESTSGGQGEGFRVPPALAGRLVQSDSGIQFMACGEQAPGRSLEARAAGDASTLFDQLDTGGAVTVMVRMDGQRISDIRFAGPEEMSCDRLPPDAVVEARGNEPFWTIRIEPDAALFLTPEFQDGVPYVNGKWTHVGDGWVYEAELSPAAGGAAGGAGSPATSRVRLELTETECGDSMSGARFPYRAVLIHDGQRLEGCALEGRQAMR